MRYVLIICALICAVGGQSRVPTPVTPAPIVSCTVANTTCAAKCPATTCACKKSFWDCYQANYPYCYNETTYPLCTAMRDTRPCSVSTPLIECVALPEESVSIPAWIIIVVIVVILLVLVLCVKKGAIKEWFETRAKTAKETARREALKDPEEGTVPLKVRLLPVDHNVIGAFAAPVMVNQWSHKSEGSAAQIALRTHRDDGRADDYSGFHREMSGKYGEAVVSQGAMSPPRGRGVVSRDVAPVTSAEQRMEQMAFGELNTYALTQLVARAKLQGYLHRLPSGDTPSLLHSARDLSGASEATSPPRRYVPPTVGMLQYSPEGGPYSPLASGQPTRVPHPSDYVRYDTEYERPGSLGRPEMLMQRSHPSQYYGTVYPKS